MMRNVGFALLLISLQGITASSLLFKGEQCIIKSEFIFLPGDVPFPSCHASTVTETSKGLLAGWFGGTAEKNPDVGIWISSFTDGIWTKPVEVADGIQNDTKRFPCWNPVLYNSGKKILLFYKVGPSPSAWWGELKVSADEGKTWSRSSRLINNIYGPAKNKPILLNNGELLCPASTEYDGWRVHIEITSDNGLTWKRTEDLNQKGIGVIQPTLLLYPGGRIEMLCRSNDSCILGSWSEYSGLTWSPFKSIGLPNPNSGIDAISLRDGRQLLVYNHLIKGRNMLNIAISDNGIDWKAAVLLENDVTGSEFSYPAVIQTNDGIIHITYTWNRRQIKHVIVDPSKIVTHSFQKGKWPLL
jgi:predicted neuraminidase